MKLLPLDQVVATTMDDNAAIGKIKPARQGQALH